MNRFITLVLMLPVLVVSLSCSAETSNEEFEKQLDFTIRSACHGYMVDALPEFLSGAKKWLQENSPFCQTVRTLPKEESAYALLKHQNPSVDYSKDPNFKISSVYGHNDDLYRNSDCDDWMCEHIRDQVYRQGHPISLADYRKVEGHCKGPGEYSCIEHWFKSWPRPLPVPKPKQADTGMSLDAMMGSTHPAPGKARPTPAPTNGVGLSLDAMMGANPPVSTVNQQAQQTNSYSAPSQPRHTSTSPDLSLDNVYAGREQIALEKTISRINSYNRSIANNCQCTLANSGCYNLPSKSLMNEAGNLEQQRYGFCSQWQSIKGSMPETSEQGKALIGKLAKLEKGINQLDKNMDQAINDWKEEQQRLIAQQEQERRDRSNTAYFAGVASVLLQTGAVMNGNLSAEQAANNAVNVSRSVENGESWGSAMTHNLKSALPSNLPGNSSYSNQPSTNSNSNGDVSGRFSFSCYSAGLLICIDYTVSSQNRFNQMKQQCQQSGSRVISSCDQGGPSCSMSTSTASQTTYDYNTDPQTYKQKCQASGGSFHSG